jgi:hypothetical protein
MCRRGIYDNMTTAVEAVFAGKERRFNRSRYGAPTDHDNFTSLEQVVSRSSLADQNSSNFKCRSRHRKRIV